MEPKDRGWWWQALRDPRTQWASTSKAQVLLGAIVASISVVYLVWTGNVTSVIVDLLGTYMAVIIIGRGLSKGLSVWENKKKEEPPNGNP